MARGASIAPGATRVALALCCPMASGAIHIGVSGWTYSGWRGNFYPRGLPQRRELAHGATAFNSIEVNGSFYSLQRATSYRQWAAATPPGFVFALKGSRYITHMLKLRNAGAALANFFASGPLALGDKLGPILWQFPARFHYDPERLGAFFHILPRSMKEALGLARRHDQRLAGRAHLEIDGDRPIRHAIEIRSDTFRNPAFIALLKAHDVALVCADTVDWPLLMDLTSDFVYCRLHGSVELYNSRYTDEELDRWAGRVRAWSAGTPMRDGNFVTAPELRPRPRDVYVYFDNTDKLHAPDNARGLMERLGVSACATVPA
jgi:uncharacterized protein YecE (DUF72 family)